ncbi:MAG: NADH/ubiquinone/plastoquinone (complex I) [Deltaproteobacteria bacterium]|jgi:multicomponent Na+:H+ antiporter subunit D|nr:NADH/ubiquinone/plastoquinone (complex I) [Deltaproteobacteria bacterium]
MTVPLPLFVAVPLAASFIVPFFGRKTRSVATLLANLATITLLVLAIYVMTTGQMGIYKLGKWSIPIGINLVLDGLSNLLLLTISVVSFAAMLFSVQYMEQYTSKPKFLSLFLLMVAGMNGVVLSGDIFNMFVFLEIASISSYALVGFGCEHEELEASFKYMVLGSVASMFILFGVGLVYGMTGTLSLADISRAVQQTGFNNGLYFALAMFIVGFGLKAALVPFHAWLPDAHPSAPAPISAMLSGVLIKALGVYALIRIIFNIFGLTLPVGWILVTLGVLSMVVGVFLAVGQCDFKRLLAYHSISQMGYVVLGVGIGAVVLAQKKDPAWASLAILGGLFHLINHSVFKSLLFLTSGSIEMATGSRQLKQLGGLAEKMPLTRTMCTIASASIAGIPPFNGFWSKLLIVLAAVKAQFYSLAAVTVLVSLVTLISFLKVQRYVFLGQLPSDLSEVRESKGSMAWSMGVLAGLCAVMGLLLLWTPLREHILTPAVLVLVQNDYSAEILSMQ